MYNVFNLLSFTGKIHIGHIYFSVSYQPVVGTLVKFPNQHLFRSKSYFSIGNLWATIKISISTQLSFKPTFNNIFSINYWLPRPWHFGKFCCWPCFVHQIVSHEWSNRKFLIFLFLFGSLAISNISLSVWYIGCQSHGILGNFTVFPLKSTISQSCQNKFNNLIPPSYGLHFGKYKMGIIGVKYTIFMQNAM